MFDFIASSDFVENLNALDLDTQARIKEKLRFFTAQENPLLHAKRLKGYKNIFRFRVGDFRIVFNQIKKTIILLKVKHRKDIYEKL